MTREEFNKLYDLLELANPGEYEYNGEDTISNEVRRGIWISIINLEDTQGKDSWSDCYDLRNANGKLWERHVLDLQGKRLEIIEDVKRAAEKVFSDTVSRSVSELR